MHLVGLTAWLVPFLRLSNTVLHNEVDVAASSLHFELRQFHAISSYTAQVAFADARHPTVWANATQHTQDYAITSRPMRVHRPPSLEAFYHAQRRSIEFGENAWLHWQEDEVLGPDVERREVLLELAKMANNAYVEPADAAWYGIGPQWNDASSFPFGWEDGFRGRIFATPDNSTVVVSIKGTSPAVFGGGGPTSKKDKCNDNLLFSCCCARVDWSWTTVCGCYRGGWKCDQNCLENALVDDSLFYPIGINLYNNVTFMYPDSNIWVVGHSLGGSLASLVGVTFGVPSVTFEAPGERMAASRLHLPSPPSTQHITHVYHTADPIPMGTCTGVLSSCGVAGYALESRCHMGQSIIYDTVSNLSWSVDVRTHGIVNVIEKILSEPWAHSTEIGREVPEPVLENDCIECYSWEYGDFPEAGKMTGS